jgi:hypothetical protein
MEQRANHARGYIDEGQKLVCHCSRKSRVFRAFGRALLAGHLLRKTRSRAVLSLLERNDFSRQAVAHSSVIYRLNNKLPQHAQTIADCTRAMEHMANDYFFVSSAVGVHFACSALE